MGDLTADNVQCNLGNDLCTVMPEDGILECQGDAVEGLPECPGEEQTSFVTKEDAPWIAGAGSAVVALGLTVVRYAKGWFGGNAAVDMSKAESVPEPVAESAKPVEAPKAKSFERSTAEFVNALLTDPMTSERTSYPEFQVRRPGAVFAVVEPGGPDTVDRMVDYVERGLDVEFIDFEGRQQCDINSGERIVDINGLRMTEMEELKLISTNDAPDAEELRSREAGRTRQERVDPLTAEVRKTIILHADSSINEVELERATLEIMARHGEDFVDRAKMFPEDRAKAIRSVLRDVRQGMTAMDGVELWELASDGRVKVIRDPNYRGFTWAEVSRMSIAEFLGGRSVKELLRGTTPLEPAVRDFLIGGAEWARGAKAKAAGEIGAGVKNRAVGAKAAVDTRPATSAAESERLKKLVRDARTPTGLKGEKEKVKLRVRGRAMPRGR